MKEIRDQEISLQKANEKLGRELPPGMWVFLVQRMNYSEIRIDLEKETVSFPGFIPFEELFSAALTEIDGGDIDARPCLACGSYHDVNQDEGIFAQPGELEGFICEPCSRKMTAWDYFHDYLTRSR